MATSSKSALVEAILRGEQLLPPETVMGRLNIDYKQLLRLIRNGHAGGFRLPAVWVGKKPRFDVNDVAEFELKCRQVDGQAGRVRKANKEEHPLDALPVQ
jgi:hypothetical protein